MIEFPQAVPLNMFLKAIFPGSFDPITKGHEVLVIRALELFDEVIVAIGSNANKKYMFSEEKRGEFIKNTFANEPRVTVDSYQGLTIDYCKEKKCKFLLRGLRNSNDFEFEKAISQINSKLNTEIETVFLITSAELSAINSSIVRDILKNNGDADQFLPDSIGMNTK